MSRFISVLRLAGLIIAASLLTACSAVKLAYNQAPDLTYWWLDGYFDFNDQQTPKVRDELARLFAWHRASELPKTADLLGQAAQLMAGEVNASQACRMYEQGRGLIDNITNQALPFMAEIAPTLTPDQIQHLKRKYEKNADAFTRDYIAGSAANREAKRFKQAVERSEMLYGKLEEPQIAVIKQALASSSFDPAATLKERQRRQKELMDLLSVLAAAKASQATSSQSLRAYIQRAWEAPDPAYRAYVQRLTNEGCTSFANVHASTTAAQRANAIKVLKGYETDLRTLAASK
jgi:predicted secreted protein